MIKIGCCLNMNAAGDPKIGAEHIPLFAELGFDYAELPLAQVMDLPDDRFRTLLDTIITGIPVESCNNFFPATIRLTGVDSNPDAAVEYAKAAFDKAAAMGVKVIVFGSSGAKNIPPGFPYESAWVQLQRLLYKLDKTIKPYGITIVMEPLNKKESNLITIAAEGLSLVEELKLDNVKLLIDYYHMRMENEDPDIIIKAGKNLRHTHIARKEGRIFPKPGDGENYGAFFTRLKTIGYDHRVSIEANSKDLKTDAEASLKYLRTFL